MPMPAREPGCGAPTGNRQQLFTVLFGLVRGSPPAWLSRVTAADAVGCQALAGRFISVQGGVDRVGFASAGSSRASSHKALAGQPVTGSVRAAPIRAAVLIPFDCGQHFLHDLTVINYA